MNFFVRYSVLYPYRFLHGAGDAARRNEGPRRSWPRQQRRLKS